MNIVVIGTGYVGLVVGTCLAVEKHHVTCVDIDERKIADLSNGFVPIYEPGLDELIAEAGDRLVFTTDVGSVSGADIVYVAVGTPQGEDGSADLGYVLEAARAIAPHLRDYTVVVVKSTVPVGTCDKVERVIAEAPGGVGVFDVVSNPEFLREGSAVNDFRFPDRIVVGTESTKALRVMAELYGSINQSRAAARRTSVLFTDRRSAELSKYASNAMLAVRISFMNEVARLCDATGANVEQVKSVMAHDPRIGQHFLNAGIGYGGSCFPKDVEAIEHMALSHGVDSHVVKAAALANEDAKAWPFETLAAHFRRSGECLKGKVVVVWGMAFKPNTDDVREAPALLTVRYLLLAGAVVRIHDPVAMPNALYELCGPDVVAGEPHDPLAVLDGADALIVCTEWGAYADVTPEQVSARMPVPVVVDARNVYDPNQMRDAGVAYYSVGRPQL